MIPARILIIDPHPATREGVRQFLAADPAQWEVCGCESSALQPDLAIVEYEGHGMDGLELAAQLGRLRRTLEVMLYTIWLLIGTALTAIAWIVIRDLSPIDIRSQAAHAAAIGYGTLHTANGSSHLIIDEIWKQSGSGSPLTVGTAVHKPLLRSGGRRLDGFIVFFGASGWSGGGRLRANAIVAVDQGRVGSEGMSFSDAKALCLAPPLILR